MCSDFGWNAFKKFEDLKLVRSLANFLANFLRDEFLARV